MNAITHSARQAMTTSRTTVTHEAPWKRFLERLSAPLYWVASKLLTGRLRKQGELRGKDATLAHLLGEYARELASADDRSAIAFWEQNSEGLEKLADTPQLLELKGAIRSLWTSSQQGVDAGYGATSYADALDQACNALQVSAEEREAFDAIHFDGDSMSAVATKAGIESQKLICRMKSIRQKVSELLVSN